MKPNMNDIRKALFSLDDTIVPIRLMQQFLAYLPSPDEVNALLEYKDNPDAPLSFADRFLLELVQIDRYEYRIRALLFKSNFDERLCDIQEVCFHHPFHVHNAMYLIYLVYIDLKFRIEGIE
jgi:hypothetical protein